MNLAFAISGFLAPVITGSVLKLQASFVRAFLADGRSCVVVGHCYVGFSRSRS
jgi:hypothetical protein